MRQIRRFQLVLLLTIVGLAAILPAVLEPPCAAGAATGSPCEKAVPSGCSVFTIAKDGAVFFGGNDDYIHLDSYYWVDPGYGKNYGAIWIGQPDNVQQGVNERGLAYDANGLPRVDTNPHLEREPVRGGYTSYPIQILQECATVEEVIAWVESHRWHSYMHDQLQFADATGDAVIISAGTDGELVFTRKPRGDGFLVSTNFNVANPANGYDYPCWRYERAQELLGQLANRENTLTVQDAAGVLDAVHVEGSSSWTIASLLADLPNGLVYIYYFYQFDQPVVLDVAEEIANPRAPGPLSRLFPEEVQREAARRHQQIQQAANRCRWVGMAWLTAVLLSLILLLVVSRGGSRGMRFWLAAVLLLGPLALMVWLIVGRRLQPGAARAVLLEVTGDVMPTVLAFVVYLVTAILVPAVQSAWPMQVALIFGLPLVVGWLVFHGLLLTPVSEKGYGTFLGQRLPQAWVTANLGIAGINMVAAPLINRSMRICPVFPLTAWTVLLWLAIVALGALVGGVILCLYELWAVRGGFRAWSVLALGEGEVRTPSWRMLWWWILLSYVALFGGIAVNVMVQQ